MHIGFWWENLREEDDLEGVSVDGKIILKWVLKKFFGSMDWIDLPQVVSSFECGNEPSVSVKCGEFLDRLINCYFLKKEYAPWIYSAPWPI